MKKNSYLIFFFFFQAEDSIRDHCVTGVQTCALPICMFMLALLTPSLQHDPSTVTSYSHRQWVRQFVYLLFGLGTNF